MCSLGHHSPSDRDRGVGTLDLYICNPQDFVVTRCKHLGIAVHSLSLFFSLHPVTEGEDFKACLDFLCQYVCVGVVVDSYLLCFEINKAIVAVLMLFTISLLEVLIPWPTENDFCL